MIVLDTNVLSEEMKPVPDSAVHLWLQLQAAGNIFTTSICQAEILLGVALLPDGQKTISPMPRSAYSSFSQAVCCHSIALRRKPIQTLLRIGGGWG